VRSRRQRQSVVTANRSVGTSVCSSLQATQHRLSCGRCLCPLDSAGHPTSLGSQKGAAGASHCLQQVCEPNTTHCTRR
jgi:hypothetical protein